jgi:hypothetical protein
MNQQAGHHRLLVSPRQQSKLPVVLSPDEVIQLFETTGSL